VGLFRKTELVVNDENGGSLEKFRFLPTLEIADLIPPGPPSSLATAVGTKQPCPHLTPARSVHYTLPWSASVNKVTIQFIIQTKTLL
jgi:hypothetical protein